MVFHAPGVQVVAQVPVALPVPPPIIVVMPDATATSTCCGQIMWTWLSTPPAVPIMPSAEITSVPGPMTRRGSTPGCTCGLPALPTATIRPSRMPMSPLTMPHQSRTTAFVMTRSRTGCPVASSAWPMLSRITLPPPKTTSSPRIAWSFSTSMRSSVSARRMRSPAVGP